MYTPGFKLHRLTLLQYRPGTKHPRANGHWLCACDCGAQPRWVDVYNLRRGMTKSCGCLSLERRRKGYCRSFLSLLPAHVPTSHPQPE